MAPYKEAEDVTVTVDLVEMTLADWSWTEPLVLLATILVQLGTTLAAYFISKHDRRVWVETSKCLISINLTKANLKTIAIMWIFDCFCNFYLIRSWCRAFPSKFLWKIPIQLLIIKAVADLGGKRRKPFSGIRPPADPKGPLFLIFRDIHFSLTDPKIFLKAPLAPKHTNFEGGARAEKKTHVLKKNCLRRAKLGQNRVFHWDSSENQFGRPKTKRSTKFFDFFLKIQTHRPSRKS